MNIIQKMRQDWNRRAKEDARFYVAFARENQTEEEFLASSREVVERLEAEFFRLPPKSGAGRRALEIGRGPGRLLLPMSRHFEEIHGVDISDEMVELARRTLAGAPHAHVQVNSGSDLSLFQDAYFDLFYS